MRNNLPRTNKPLLMVWLGIALLSFSTGVALADERLITKVLEEREEFACLTREESDLLNSLNAYRVRNRLRPIQHSRSLTMVARAHAIDLVENRPDQGTDARGRECNLHSWSNTRFWSPVCYTGDHQNLARMLSKPREITRRMYEDIGYENVYWTSVAEVYSFRVLDTWQKSPKHNALILEAGEWRGSNWAALGVGIYRNVAVMWLGSMKDPLGPLPPCASAAECKVPR